MSAALLLLAGCGPAPPAGPTVQVGPVGVVVESPAGVQRVRLRDPAGLPVVTRRLPAPVERVELPWVWEEPGAWSAEVWTGAGDGQPDVIAFAVVPGEGELLVEVDAPVGQGGREVEEGERLTLPRIDGTPGQLAVTATALRAGEARLAVLGPDEQVLAEEVADLQPGERLALLATIDGPVRIDVQGPTHRFSLPVEAPAIPAAALAADLSIVAVDLPADGTGAPDPGRAAGRVTLPARWWTRALSVAGLGVRARDPWAPWSFVGVALRNDGERDQNVLVRLQITEADGSPAPAFRRRLRAGDDGGATVQGLLRLPAGRTVLAALPLFVDESLLDQDLARATAWTRRVEVLPLGGGAPLLVDEGPLYATRGSTVASLGLVAALLAALSGTVLLWRRGGRWLAAARTSELMTIGLFGALTFVVSAIGRLLTMGLASVLGPFATFATGLVDDCLRYTLLATLLTLVPRVGTASLAVLTGWLLSGIALGSFGPTDLLFVGGRVFWLESLLWLTGITRVVGWQDQGPWARWARLGLGLGGASLLTSATGLVLHVTLYRLFLAEWYVVAVLALPGFLYVLFACALAVPFAESLRRIQR
ncbi:MAG: hypothetical protein H6742_21765 [Alphaproteobacteria bacterium]|nr:hypothetical protein [Alphaproteobacteria bacterium]